jgi:hypothetical protein
MKLDGEDAELWFRKAVVHRHRGERAEAERCWRLILKLKRPDQFCSFDQGIYGHQTRKVNAVCAVRSVRAIDFPLESVIIGSRSERTWECT